jgi:hypothetical protein
MIRAAAMAVLAGAAMFGQVHFTKGANRIEISINGRPFSTLVLRSESPKPYLAPVRAASGTIVTRQWPMDRNAKESHDHPHHRGLFDGYVRVNGIDFWGIDPSAPQKNSGHIVPHKIEQIRDGAKEGVLRVTFDWVDPPGRTLVKEHRTMTFHADPKLRIMDFDMTFTAGEDLTFDDDKDGMFAIRVADALNEGHGGTLVNSGGAEHEKNTWGHRASWMDYYGSINGEKLGIAMFDHPSNPGYPNRFHCRGYGLFAINPFGQHAFDPSLPVKTTKLAKGSSLRYRWRVVVHPGDVRSANIAGLFRAWTGQQ